MRRWYCARSTGVCPAAGAWEAAPSPTLGNGSCCPRGTGAVIRLEGRGYGPVYNSVRQEKCADAHLVLLARDGAETDGVVVDSPPRGELGVGQAVWGPCHREPGRRLQIAHNLVPLQAHACV